MNVLRTIGSFFSADTLDCDVKRGILVVAIIFEWLAITVLLFSVLGPWEIHSCLKVSLFYGIGSLLLFAIAGVNIYHGKNGVEIYKKIALVGVWIAAIMMLLCAIQPSISIRNIAKDVAANIERSGKNTAKNPAAMSTIDIAPGEIYTVGLIQNGQRWEYNYSNGAFFSHRVKKDENTGWRDPEGILSWRAIWSGTLQIKAGKDPVIIAVKIL